MVDARKDRVMSGTEVLAYVTPFLPLPLLFFTRGIATDVVWLAAWLPLLLNSCFNRRLRRLFPGTW
jgi:hypothetical protein